MIRVAFVGDVGLAMQVPGAIRAQLSRGSVPEYVQRLRSADLAVCNLELPFSEEPVAATGVRSVAHVDDAPLLGQMGFGVASLANNHVADAGATGIQVTRAALSELGIHFNGAGGSLDEALEPSVVTVGGVRIGFLSFCEGTKLTHPHIARTGAAGAAPLDARILRRSVRQLRQAVDVLVVSMHQGLNYVHYASPRQRRFEGIAADEGADLIVGHHPHVLQGWEKMGSCLVFHSLGEFLWDPSVGNVVEQRWDRARRQTLILEVTLGQGREPEFEIFPYRRSPELELEPLSGSDGNDFQNWFAEVSAVYTDYDPRVFLAAADRGVVEHTTKVIVHNLRKGNLGYLAGLLTRIRGRHIRIGWTHLKNRIFGTRKSS